MITTCAFALALAGHAQTQYDAARLMGSELNGTARFVGMGGAMGALGGDISVIGTNPAAMGIFRSNDISVTFGFNNTSAKSTFNGTTLKDDRTRMSFDQVGFVYSNKIGNNTALRYVNFGFNYHKSKNLNQLFAAGGNLEGLSQTWQMANMVGNAMPNGVGTGVAADEIFNAKNPYTDNKYIDYPYLGLMGVRTDLVAVSSSDDKLMGWNGEQSKYTSQEEGGINQYDFNLSFNIEDQVYLGLTLGAYDVKYKRSSYYTEDIFYRPEGPNAGEDVGAYGLTNWFETRGTGIDLKLGVVARPFEDSPFRIGLAVHTPTWYDLTDYHASELIVDYTSPSFEKPVSWTEYTPDYVGADTERQYKLVTPWKFNVSMGTTLEGIVALGAEYEYMDYSSAKLKYEDGSNMDFQNEGISSDLKKVHALRVGMEARVTPAFSMRAGYNFRSAAFKDSAYKMLNPNDTRTDTEYHNTQAVNTATFGLGYRGSVIYADLAYKYDMYKSDFYAFDDVDLKATKVDHNRHQLLFTLGARF